MDTFQWRRAARIVAYLDVVLTSMALVVVIYVTSILGIVTVVGNGNNPGLTNNYSSSHPKHYLFANDPGYLHPTVTINWVIWFIVASLAVLTIVHLWGAVQLLKATDSERQLHQALKHAGSWLHVTVTMVSFQFVALLLAERYISSVIWIMPRIAFLVIGCKFMSEVRSHITSSTTAPAHVTVVTLRRKN